MAKNFFSQFELFLIAIVLYCLAFAMLMHCKPRSFFKIFREILN
ncbi:hypothetical protein T4D_6596 [Trichinella pseudospiralis]|uniref:Uncharacterized protein n=1 Tax=Trichinella pseudospiralis TaxID=6337 RepID=A0A0V1DQB8_TRIPS|nr:hypothetical protein T4D_6596 [Trichinella pseudospiralis]